MEQITTIGLNLVAARTRNLAMSAIKEMSILSAKVPDAASLAWSLRSFRTPEPIRAAVTAALEGDPNIGMCMLPGGLPEICTAAARGHERRAGLRVNAKQQVMISAGNMEALQTLLHAIVDPGKELNVINPGFVSHISQIRFNSGMPVFRKMDEANGWEPDINALPGLIGPRTMAIVLVTPSNPTGAILSGSTPRTATWVARDHGVLIIPDDPCGHFTCDDADKLHNLAADAGFTRIPDRRHKLICDQFNRIPYVFASVRPEGPCYIFPRMLATQRNSMPFAHDLVNEVHVTVTPGGAFGPSDKSHVRMAYCEEDDIINLAFNRMEAHFDT